MIDKYITDLLYDFECVIIPGLGGFLTNDKPASIQTKTHHFHPPYKRVMFNAYLKTNDGLLVNYIAREENIPYKEAKEQVDKFVSSQLETLKLGERVIFDKIGALYLNENKKIVFEQDNLVNYNAEAFGLADFVSPAIYRSHPEEKLRQVVSTVREKKTVSAKQNKKQQVENAHTSGTSRKKHAKRQAVQNNLIYRLMGILLVVLVITAFLGWNARDRAKPGSGYDNFTSVIPFFYAQPNAYVIDNIDKVNSSGFGSWWIGLFEKSHAVHKTKVVASNTSSAVSIKHPVVVPTGVAGKPEAHALKKTEIHTPAISKVTLKSSPKNTASKPVPVRQMAHSRQYIIITGSFKDVRNVQSLIALLQKKGYNAFAAGSTSNGLHRVAVGTFHRFWQAKKQLGIIREKENPAAWILVK